MTYEDNDGSYDNIMTDDERVVQKGKIRMTQLRKENDELDLRNKSNGEKQILHAVNNDNGRGNCKGKDMAKNVVLFHSKSGPKASKWMQKLPFCIHLLNL